MSDVLYEAHFEKDDGWQLDRDTGKMTAWSGWPVRYRPLGTRRWSRFVTDSDLDNLSVDEIQTLCRAASAVSASATGEGEA